MVERTFRGDEGLKFVIRPNRSLSWTQTKIVYGVFAATCLIVAIAFTFMGFWPVLPFAGAEVVVLGLGFYLCALGGRDTEVIRIKDDSIEIEKGRRSLRKVCEFKRSWAQIALLPPSIRWYPSRLVIRSHGKQVQLGAFLTDGEREQLACELKRAITLEQTFSDAAVDTAARLV